MRTRTNTKTRLLIGGTVGVLSLLISAGCSSGSSNGTTSGSGGGGGAGAGAASVTIAEKLVSGQPDEYTFSPASVTVSAGGTLSVVNKSDEEHKLACTPDPGIAATALEIEKNGTGSLAFAKAGTYTCTSTTHPDAKVTVTVS